MEPTFEVLFCGGILMAEVNRTRGAIKFFFWTALSVALVGYMWWSHSSGQMTEWYYYQADMDGYAVNANYFQTASKEKPATLEIGAFKEIAGLQAVPVKKGDRLPVNCNGVISKKEIDAGKRVKLDGNTIKVTVPVEMKEARGFKYKDSFKHKGILTNQWSGVWNVLVICALGLTLGLMAEGFTDWCGYKVEKIKHFETAH
jgi:hypothetical protein